MKKPTVIIIIVIAVIAGWYLLSPLFTNTTVNEDFPDIGVDIPSQRELDRMDPQEKSQLEQEVVSKMAELPTSPIFDVMPALEAPEPPADMPNVVMAVPAPNLLKAGTFTDADNFHKGSGTASVYQLGDSKVLRLEEFSVTNGPDLRVLLSKHPSPTTQEELGKDYISLGKLKGNMGNQNYDILDNVDLSQYQSVVIYCQPFHVVFSAASLSEA